LWKEKSGRAYQRQPGAASHRRSLYTIWKRTSPPPSMILFDAPGREVCTAQRSVTQTPLQALVTLNDPQFVEAARGIAYRLLQQNDVPPDERADALCRQMLGRPGDATEKDVIVSLVAQQRERFSAHPEAAEAFLQIGDFRVPTESSTPPAELAAWTVAAQTLMNLDEWLTR
jgi:hypothetical protein